MTQGSAPRRIRTGIVVLTTLFVVTSLALGPLAASAATSTAVRLEPSSITMQAGETTQVDVVVGTASGGVGAYSATINLSDPAVAEITDVTVAGNPDMTDVSISSNGGSASIDAALMDTPNSGTVVIATLTLQANAEGTTHVSLDVSSLGDEAGNGYTVTDSPGGSITVGSANAPPTATITYTPTDPAVNESVTFDGTDSADTDGTIETYEWDFDGDDSPEAIGAQVTHAFQRAGDHEVSLTVVDDDGAAATATETVSVGDASTTTTTTNATTTTTTTTSAVCRPGPEEPIMQAVQLHTTDTRIEAGDPGQISGAIATSITNNCPVKVQLTLQVPNGVRIQGGTDIQSGGGGLLTSTFVVQPGEVKSISATVYGTTRGQKVIRSSITYFPVGHEEMARQQDTTSLAFTVVSSSELTTTTTSMLTPPQTTPPTATPSTTTVPAPPDSDGDGVPDEEDYAPNDPNVQSKSDLQDQDTDTETTVPGFTSLTGLVAGGLAVLVLLRRHR